MSDKLGTPDELPRDRRDASAPVFADIRHEAEEVLIRIHDRPLQDKPGNCEERAA